MSEMPWLLLEMRVWNGGMVPLSCMNTDSKCLFKRSALLSSEVTSMLELF